MHFKSENMITFTTALNSYKYKLLFFNLINNLIRFNNILTIFYKTFLTNFIKHI